MIAIVDYDAGNLMSVKKALEYIGETPVVTRDVKQYSRQIKLFYLESEHLATVWKSLMHTGFRTH